MLEATRGRAWICVAYLRKKSDYADFGALALKVLVEKLAEAKGEPGRLGGPRKNADK